MKLDTKISSTLLAAWLKENYPEIYKELAYRIGDGTEQHLAGFTDFLQSVGSNIANVAQSVASGLSTGVQAVGSFLSSDAGQKTLASLSQAYGAMNSSAIQVQAQRAQQGQAPAVINTVYDPATGTYVPTHTDASGRQIPISPSVLAKLNPSFLSRYGLWIVGGGAALVILYFILSRK